MQLTRDKPLMEKDNAHYLKELAMEFIVLNVLVIVLMFPFSSMQYTTLWYVISPEVRRWLRADQFLWRYWEMTSAVPLAGLISSSAPTIHLALQRNASQSISHR